MASDPRIAGDMSIAAAGGGRWDALNRDLLVNIFQRVGVADLIVGVPLVCSSWRDASLDPFCWRYLDLRQWGLIAKRIEDGGLGVLEMTSFLLFCCVTRGCGMLESILFPTLASLFDFRIVADRCPNLLYFSLSDPDIDETIFCQTISELKALKGMAIDESLVKETVLMTLQRSCIYFTDLRVFAEHVDEEMASIVCKYLPCLRKLEINDSYISTKAIITFLDKLKELEHFDISGYENSSITDEVLNKALRLKVFIWNSRFDLGEFMDCSNCEEDFHLQRSCQCMLHRRMMEWLSGFLDLGNDHRN